MDTVAHHADQPSRYLTDGVSLYRYLSGIGGTGDIVGLENCRSLGVMLLPGGELQAWRLRAVKPADGEQAGLGSSIDVGERMAVRMDDRSAPLGPAALFAGSLPATWRSHVTYPPGGQMGDRAGSI